MGIAERLADLTDDFLAAVERIEQCDGDDEATAFHIARRDELIQTIGRKLMIVGAMQATVEHGDNLVIEYEVDRNQPLGLNIAIHVETESAESRHE